MANAYLEGTYIEISFEHRGRYRRDAQIVPAVPFPGGILSDVASEAPGSIHEGGELGYALVHAYRAAFDNPDLVVACVIGDGEAETGPLAASWHSNKFLNPVTDGAVLSILHLNGYRPRRRVGHPRRSTTSADARRTTGRPPLHPRTRRG